MDCDADEDSAITMASEFKPDIKLESGLVERAVSSANAAERLLTVCKLTELIQLSWLEMELDC